MVAHSLARLWLCLSCLLGAGTGLTAVEVELRAPAEVVPGAAFDLELRIIDIQRQFRPPQLPKVEGLQLLHAANKESSQRIITDQRTFLIKSLFYHGLAEKAGTYTIPPVQVVFVDGSSAASAPVTIIATPGDARLVDFAYVEASFEPTVVVPGQRTTLNLDVYHRRLPQNKGMTGPGIEPPAAASEVRQRDAVKKEVYGSDGSIYEHTRFSWEMTFGAAGTHQVGGQQDFFQREYFGPLKRFHSAPVKPATIEVVPFPQAGRPREFSGAIGPLEVSAGLERPRISLGEGTVYQVEVRGAQLANLSRPELQPRGQYRLYPLQATDSDGGRLFTWSVEPLQTGELLLPQVTINYFDPQARRFATAESPPVRLHVVPGRRQQVTIVGQPAASSGPGKAAAAGLAGILPGPLRRSGGPDWPWWLLPIAGVLALLLTAGAGALRRQLAERGPPPLGKQLARLRRQRDLEGINRLLHRALPQLQGADAERCRRSIAAIEAARYGGGERAEAVQADLAELERRL